MVCILVTYGYWNLKPYSLKSWPLSLERLLNSCRLHLQDLVSAYVQGIKEDYLSLLPCEIQKKSQLWIIIWFPKICSANSLFGMSLSSYLRMISIWDWFHRLMHFVIAARTDWQGIIDCFWNSSDLLFMILEVKLKFKLLSSFTSGEDTLTFQKSLIFIFFLY